MDLTVIKIGSNIIASEKGLDESGINDIARVISTIHDNGQKVAIVSSGAIAAGKNKLQIKGRIRDISVKQAAAAIGQSSLMWAYEKAFAGYNKKVAQILLTGVVLSDRRRYINTKNTLSTLLSLDVIPVINENDTVSTEEIKFGDNDRLAALVATLLESKRLIILSDVDGLYTDDPARNKKAGIIHRVEEITPELMEKAKGSNSMVGTGGMYSKLLAAQIASDNCIPVNILNGKKPELLLSLLSGEPVGTTIEPGQKKYCAKKGWIVFSVRSKGTLTLDSGAVKAIAQMGKSLLPSGIRSLTGIFDRGDAVYCADMDGKRISKGLVNYSSPELLKIIGKKTSQIESLLGYKYSDEVIHRDNMAAVG